MPDSPILREFGTHFDWQTRRAREAPPNNDRTWRVVQIHAESMMPLAAAHGLALSSFLLTARLLPPGPNSAQCAMRVEHHSRARAPKFPRFRLHDVRNLRL